MSNPNKDKGTRAETAVARYLRTVVFYAPATSRDPGDPGWPHAEPRRNAGRYDKGDITGIPGVVIEVKAAETLKIPQWVRETKAEMANAEAGYGMLVVKRPYRPVEQWDAYVPMSQLGPVHASLTPGEDPWVRMELRHAVAEMAVAGY